jgi:hypothetical protein
MKGKLGGLLAESKQKLADSKQKLADSKLLQVLWPQGLVWATSGSLHCPPKPACVAHGI